MTDGEILWKLTEGRKQDEEIVMPSMREKVPEEKDRGISCCSRSLVSRQ